MARGQPRLFHIATLLRRAIRNLLRRLPGLALLLGLATSFAWASHRAFVSFDDEVGAMQQLSAEHPVQRAGDLAGQLFSDLLRNRELKFDQQSAELRLGIDCRSSNSGFSPGAQADAAPAQRNVEARLCRSDIGADLASEILAWNAHVAMIAIRDDGDRDAPCRTGGTPVFYLPTGCHPSAWHAAVDLGAAHPPAGALDDAPAPGLFGFLALAKHEGFGDWRRFDATILHGGVMILERHFDPQAQRGPAAPEMRQVTIDVAGDVQSAAWVDQEGRPRAAVDAGAVLCEGEATSDNCETRLKNDPEASLRPRARRLTVDVSRRSGGTLAIWVRPVSVAEANVLALRKAEFRDPGVDEAPDDDTDHRVRFTRHIVVDCDDAKPHDQVYDTGEGSVVELPDTGDTEGAGADAPFRSCALLWDRHDVQSVVAASAEPPGTFVVRAAGGPSPRPLTELRSSTDPDKPNTSVSHVVASAAARELGLLSVVGFDENDANSLIGQMHRRVLAGTDVAVDLTIDPELQAKTFAAVKGLAERRPDTLDIARHLPQAFDSVRRIAVVLVDAGAVGEDAAGSGFDDDTGRILAAASLPQITAILSEWDLLALEDYRGAVSPIATRAWSQNDRFNTAGSTFKPLVALAAIDKAARGDDVLTRMLGAEPGQPGLGKDDIPRLLGTDYGFGWDATTLDVPKFSARGGAAGVAHLHSDEGEPVSRAALGTNRVGLFGAMATSNNVWFARLALAMDEDAVSTLEPDGTRAEFTDKTHNDALSLARMVDRLWPDAAHNLLPGIEPPLTPVSRLSATPIRISESNPKLPRLLNVALNGFGQGDAQVTPLSLASVMASLATGRIVLPRLTPDLGPAPPPQRGAPLLDPDPVAGRSLDPVRAASMVGRLRESLAAVVRRDGGTARVAFLRAPLLAKRMHGKTGTAQIGAVRRDDPAAHLNTVWFDGWVDGLAPLYPTRRIAFACMVTHADREKGTVGGSVCAPLIRKLLEAIEQPKTAAGDAPPAQDGPAGHETPVAPESASAPRRAAVSRKPLSPVGGVPRLQDAARAPGAAEAQP